MCVRFCCSIPFLLCVTILTWWCVYVLEAPRLTARRAAAAAAAAAAPGLRVRGASIASSAAASAASGAPPLQPQRPRYIAPPAAQPSPLDLELFLLAGARDAAQAVLPSFYVPPPPSREEALAALLAAGADANYRSPTWSTPLHRAAAAGYLGVVRLLAAAGADANAVDVYGASVATVAAREGRAEVLQELLALKVDIHGPHVTSDASDALMRACRRGHEACAELLLRAGASVDTRDKQGRTPLMYAVQDNRLGMVKLLLEHKASYAARSADGVTAASWAATYKRDEIIDVLNAAGAGIEKGVLVM